MTCSSCLGDLRIPIEDEDRERGFSMVVCSVCCCTDCEQPLSEPHGYCQRGCEARAKYATAGAFVQAAARMHFGAGTSQNVALANSYRRRREYCTRKARALGEHVGLALKGAAQRVELLAAFAHVFEAA